MFLDVKSEDKMFEKVTTPNEVLERIREKKTLLNYILCRKANCRACTQNGGR